VVKAVNSPRIKVLYDAYHMQIMEGDLIRTIRDNHQWIAHYHTGGVPGRHELDETQELQWRSVAKAIADTGYTGYFAHEFVPTRDPLTSLREAVALWDVVSSSRGPPRPRASARRPPSADPAPRRPSPSTPAASRG